MRLILDEVLSARIAGQLRARDRDVVAVAEDPGLRGLLDPDLFAHAHSEGRALVTYNREDFLALDREYRSYGREHHGIVILHPRRFPQGAASIGPLVLALAAFAAGETPHPSFVHWLQRYVCP